MEQAVNLIVSRWGATFVGFALLSGLIWYFGPLVPGFQSELNRAIAILVLFAICGGVSLAVYLIRRRRDKRLTEGVAGAEPDPSTAASAEEAEAIREKLTQALELLKKARGTKGYLYEQPWYVIIGPPGAGKTTALLNSGLRFPLANEMGQGAVAGVGGTRLCDWWFTEEAVLIDTAGRYTTQDSDAKVDRAGWESFLDLLKRTRARQPLNGVIAAIALSDIAAAPREERIAHARAIRRRIKEIQERLAIRLPVYAVFTKADLLAGFTEYFDDLDREKRSQVWGATFPLTGREAGSVGDFAAEFKLLIERLDGRIFERLQTERSPERRAVLAGLSSQVASLEAPLAEFMQEAFGGSRLDPAPMLRGFYFTSGTQEGTPIDRLTSVLARSFGLDQRRLPSLRPEQGRSYFLSRLVKEVVFGEAMLGSERPGAARRRLLWRIGAFAAIALVVLGGAAWLWYQRHSAEDQLAAMRAAVAAYEQHAGGLKLDKVAESDLPKVLPLLDEARALPYGYEHPQITTASWLSLGLSQDAKLAAGARAIYRHALERILLPRLIWRLETQMHGYLGQPDYLYEATRVYLMLGNQGPLDKSLVRSWMALDWQAQYPGAVEAPIREGLGRHLEALLAEPLPSIPLDGALVEAARATFSRVPLASRVYSRIKPSADAQAVPPWRPSEALGAAGARVFVRASGKPLTDGIPGFYTVNGFYTVLLPALGNATREVASESWVLGARAELAPDSPEARQLEHDVIAQYEADYAKYWDAMLADLNIVPLRNPQQAVQDLYILASPQSPMRDLLVAVARQLTLSQPPPPPAGGTSPGGAPAAPKPASAPAGLRPLTPAGAAPAAAEPGKEIDERYRALREFVGSGPGAPLDQALKAMDGLRQQFVRLAAAPAPGAPTAPAPPSSDDPVAELRAVAVGAPQPVQRWLEAMVGSAATLRGATTAEQVKRAYNAPGGPAALCRQTVAGRYPFSPGAANDIPLDDFAKLFAPGGLLDGFFNTQLRPFVDVSAPAWKGQPVDGVAAPIAPAELAMFQRAAQIRDMYFGSGGNTPAVRFDLTPMSLDAGAKTVTLELGGTSISYDHGPPRATQVTWPGGGMGTARVTFDPAPTSGGAPQASGPWALFRLFEQGSLHQAGSADRFQLSFQAGERQASFELRAGSVLNPFARNILRDFRCPNL